MNTHKSKMDINKVISELEEDVKYWKEKHPLLRTWDNITELVEYVKRIKDEYVQKQ